MCQHPAGRNPKVQDMSHLSSSLRYTNQHGNCRASLSLSSIRLTALGEQESQRGVYGREVSISQILMNAFGEERPNSEPVMDVPPHCPVRKITQGVGLIRQHTTAFLKVTRTLGFQSKCFLYSGLS